MHHNVCNQALNDDMYSISQFFLFKWHQSEVFCALIFVISAFILFSLVKMLHMALLDKGI